MPDTVSVTLQVDAAAAAALADDDTRAAMGRLISRALAPEGPDMDVKSRTAANRPGVDEFRRFRQGRTLGGLSVRALLRQGLR